MDMTYVAVWTTIAFVLAFFTETMVEYVFGTPMDKIEKLQPFKWALMYISAAVGIFFACFFKLDLIYVLGYSVSSLLGQPEILIPTTWVGMGISGAVIGRGAEYLHKFIMTFFDNPKLPNKVG